MSEPERQTDPRNLDPAFDSKSGPFGPSGYHLCSNEFLLMIEWRNRSKT